MNWLTEGLKESHHEEKRYHEAAITTLQTQYNQLQNRIDQAYTDKLDGKIPEDLFLRKMNGWREEQSGFLNQIQVHQKANESYFIQGSKLLELANKAHSLYLQQTSHQKARLLRIVQSNCTWDGLTPRPIYKKPFDMLAARHSPSRRRRRRHDLASVLDPDQAAQPPSMNGHRASCLVGRWPAPTSAPSRDDETGDRRACGDGRGFFSRLP